MSELSSNSVPPAPWPNRDGWVHHEALFSQAVQIQVDQSGSIVPLSPGELDEVRSRDVGASTELPRAEVRANPSERTVTITLDEKSAAVVLYAATLLASNYEAHAREVQLVADQMPEGSFGQANRLEIVSRHDRIARRLRVVEHAYLRSVDKRYYGI